MSRRCVKVRRKIQAREALRQAGRGLALFLLLIIPLLAGCARGTAVPVTRVALMTPTPVAVEPEQPGRAQPGPVPTNALSTFGARLTVGQEDGAPLHGAPPYTARLTADYHAQPGGLPAPCEHLVWLFGDGKQAQTSCVIDATSAPHDWQTTHRYEQPGIYHAHAQMRLADGTIIASEKSQTVLVAESQGQDLQETVVRWVAWVTLLMALGLALIWLLLQRGARRRWAMSLLVFLLITFVPPFSYVPDPLGIVLAVTGGYQDDLRVPLANRFLIAGDPTEALRPTLDALIGHTGLDPLDARSPLARYAFVKVKREAHHTAVYVRFVYENGAQRTYPLPLRHPSGVLGFYTCCWRFDGLGRLRSAHLPLPPVPLAQELTDQKSLARLGLPQRLALPPVGAEEAQNWFGAAANPQSPRLVWSPRGDAFLMPVTEHTMTALWLLEPQRGAARVVADNVWEYGWVPAGAPVGEAIVYSKVQHDATSSVTGPLRQIMLVRRESEGIQHLLSLPVGQSAFPDLTAQGLWVVQDGALWLLSWEAALGGGELQRLAVAPGADAANARRWLMQVRAAPGGERVAYTCDAALCLMDADGRNHTRAVPDDRPVSLAWRADGQQLATVFWDYAGGDERPVRLVIVARDGAILADLDVALQGLAGTPQWLPDGDSLLLQTYPHDGRRIIWVQANDGDGGWRAVDLSQPRWDAFFALHPGGDRLLLSNGRGGFWMAPLQHAPGTS